MGKDQKMEIKKLRSELEKSEEIILSILTQNELMHENSIGAPTKEKFSIEEARELEKDLIRTDAANACIKEMLDLQSIIMGIPKREIDETINNGGKSDYYQTVRDFDDFAEWHKLNGFQFNIGKVFWTMNTERHSGTDYERDLNKIIDYVNREKMRIAKERSENV